LDLCLQLSLALAVSRLYLQTRGSLEESGHWISSKTRLERGVMGAFHFMRSEQAQAGHRLNLGAWFGYQEVLYKRPLRPAQLSFAFLLQQRAQLSVVFDKTDSGFSGIRLSVDPVRESMAFTASDAGEFLGRVPLAGLTLRPREWARASLDFEADRVRVDVNGAVFRVPRREPAGEARVGFRGGGRIALVDDVVIKERGAPGDLKPRSAIYESFDDAEAFWPAAGLAIALVLGVNALWRRRLLRRDPSRAAEVALGGVVANGVLCVLAGVLLAFLAYRAERYPDADTTLQRREDEFRGAQADAVRAEIRARYPGPPPPGVLRILFLGSSQTWGAGAARASETFVAVLERLLNAEADSGRRYECVNAGISAVDSRLLADLYEHEWLGLRPRLVVVDLSNNDGDASLFGLNLERIVKLSRANGVTPLLVLEPNSPEERKASLDELLERHAVMRRVGERLDVPVFDMQARLIAEQDRGFLFWDSVHMTSFGQRLFAEALLPELQRLLD
jgi:lysophospholipase L1-like esterase